MIKVLSQEFRPDFDEVCKRCGSSPCVVELHPPAPNVISFSGGPVEVETELCGPCYFNDQQMLDYWLWNDYDTTYLPSTEAPYDN